MQNRKHKTIKYAVITCSYIFLILCIIFLSYKAGYIKSPIKHDYNYLSNSRYDQRVSVFSELDYPDADIVFVGDSTTLNCDWASLFPDYIVVNQGIGSDTSEGVLNRLEYIIKCNPEKVFLNIGINDLSYGIHQQDTVNNYTSIIEELKSALPDTDIICIGVYPVSENSSANVSNAEISELNAMIKQVCDTRGISYADFSDCFTDISDYVEDGVHLHGHVYNLIADRINNYLK